MTDDPKTKRRATSIDQTVEISADVQQLLTRMAGEQTPTRCLVVMGGLDVGRVLPLRQDRVVAGRDPSCDLVVTDSGTSRRHAELERTGDDYTITDLDSRNGVFVNGERVKSRQLRDGDKILLGQATVLKYESQDEIELEYLRQLRSSLSTDGLTGVLNRRALDERLQSEWSYTARHDTSLSALIIDVDHFKKINDTWGHAVGDQVLRAMASSLADQVRAEDHLGRYGGEEFVVVARGIGAGGAARLGERLRTRVEALQILHEGKPIPITVSIGVATTRGSEMSSAALMERADKRLYEAKNGGRNRVVAD